jgi:peptidoglycan hydrolase-like protein with peptidoglycan-binding domain
LPSRTAIKARTFRKFRTDSCNVGAQPMRRVAGLASLLILLCFEAPGWAATITVIPNQTRSLVTIRGELEFGDEDTFAEKVLRLKEAVVIFNSPGGNLVAGLEIGRAIRLKGFDTFVPDGMVCASACGLAWLGGKTLLAGPRAQIGFHAAWAMEGGQKRETGPGNALVGAYLHSLGLRDEAIVYLTLASPDEAKWLNFKDANELGIQVKEVPSFNEPSTQVATKPAELSTPPQKSSVPDAVYLDADVSSEPKSLPPAVTPSPDVRTVAVPPLQPSTHFKWRPEDPVLEPQVLNLANIDASAQVQRRLQERGFFVGLVDGVWGPKSRIALRDFKAANGLGSDDQWSQQVQLALFDDRYSAASAGYSPPDPLTTTAGLFRPFLATLGTSLHPLNPQDALKIQSELSRLGYYRSSGDGIWGLASRNALRDLKVANGLTADDVWDGSVQSIILSGRALPAIETPFGTWAMTGASCTGPDSARRLSVSSREISSGGSVCHIENGLTHSGDMWTATASCPGDGRDFSIRIVFRIIQGRLIDHTTVGPVSVTNARPPTFERCT